MAQSREVLPTNVKPLHYDLTLEPDLENFVFQGTVITEYVKENFLIYLFPLLFALSHQTTNFCTRVVSTY